MRLLPAFQRTSTGLLVLLVLAALARPATAAAAPSSTTATAPSSIDKIPDLLAVPHLALAWQCGVCAPAGGSSIDPLPEPEVVWSDIGSWFRWLAVQLFNNVARPIICAMLALAQAVLNLVATAVDLLVVRPVNVLWRVFWVQVDLLERAWSAGWLLVQGLRDLTWQVLDYLLSGLDYVCLGLVIVQQLLDLAVWVLAEVAVVIAAVASALAWLLGLVVTLVTAIGDAFANPPPTPTDGLLGIVLLGPLFDALVQVFQALKDSRLGPLYWLSIGMMYLGLAGWLLRQAGSLNR